MSSSCNPPPALSTTVRSLRDVFGWMEHNLAVLADLVDEDALERVDMSLRRTTVSTCLSGVGLLNMRCQRSLMP